MYPAVEVNVRMTMGRVAIEIESQLRKKGLPTEGFWKFYSLSEINRIGFTSFGDFEKHLLEQSKGNIISTTPAMSAQQTWTVIHDQQ